MTQRRRQNKATLRLLMMALPLVVSIGGASAQTSPIDDEELREENILLNESWRHAGFHLISDIPGDNLESFLNQPSYGFALTYIKHDRKGILDGGFDVGFQPIGGFDTTITVDADGADTPGTLHVRNQLAHAHFVLRMTLFQNFGFQPFMEGYGGIRGSLLRTRLVLDGDDERQRVNDVPFFYSNLNFGYAAGLRLHVRKRTFVTVRYAQMFHLNEGNVVQVANPDGIVIDNSGKVRSTSTSSVTLPPYSIRVGLAINL